MMRMMLVLLAAIALCGCNGASERERAELQRRLERMEKRIDNLDRVALRVLDNLDWLGSVATNTSELQARQGDLMHQQAVLLESLARAGSK